MRALADLRLLRSRGKAPVLPVFVTTSDHFARQMRGIGAIVIPLYDDPTQWDWRPIAGLDVILCAVSRSIAETIRAARPRRLQALHSDGLSVIP